MTNQIKSRQLSGQMSLGTDAARLMQLYPKIFVACHRRHVKDPSTRQLLSAHQASIIDHLDDVSPTTVNDLAAHMGVTASTMSLAIDRLERGGYVRRAKDRSDKRRVLLRLTARGVRVKEQQSVLDPDAVRLMLTRLSPTVRRRALEGLALLAHAADQSPPKFDRLRKGSHA